MTFSGFLKLLPWLLLLVLAIILVWFWKLKDDSAAALLAAQNVHATDVAVHKEDVATIKAVTAFRADDDKIVLKFTNDLQAINDRFATLNTSIANLERTNAQVRDYLSQPIPSPLAVILNDGVRDEAGSAEPSH